MLQNIELEAKLGFLFLISVSIFMLHRNNEIFLKLTYFIKRNQNGHFLSKRFTYFKDRVTEKEGETEKYFPFS